ncbi:ATP-binding protein [Nakamurella sp. A5-74]|uniref:histidine kinase n=1 Tax=Nakamurella sp. A5-74 TaxID=3158264 RepID=A0AAU8DI82_9ACTN
MTGRWARWSLRRRLSTSFAAALVTVLLIGVAVFMVALSSLLSGGARTSARAQAEQLASIVATGGLSPPAALESVPADGARLQVIDAATGAVLAGSDVIARHQVLSNSRPPPGHEVVVARGGVLLGDDSSTLVTRSARTPDGRLYVVVVSRPHAVEARTFTSATVLLVIGAAIWVLLVLVMVDRIVRRTLRPVMQIHQDVSRISSAGSTERVTVPPSGDEIAALAQTMNDMLDRLTRADTAGRQLISDASHELRSPLATIRATLETAPAAEQATPSSRVLYQEVLRMQHLVENMLTLAKAADPGLQLVAEDVDLDDLVDLELRRLRQSTPLVVSGSVRAARVRGDPARLGQVLRNLTDNAARYAASQVSIDLRSEDGRAVITVDDDGPGIPVQDREAVFERFSRLQPSRDRDAGGSGLGLAIARTLVGKHGGTVIVGESPRGGARFVMSLALAPPDDSPAQGPGSD